MKRILFIFAAVFLGLFLAVTVFKNRAPNESSGVEAYDQTQLENERVIRFWKTYRRATRHRIAGELQEAAEAYRNAIRLKPDHEDALYYLGNVAFDLGEFTEAQQSLTRLIQVNPNSARAHLRLGDFYLSLEKTNFFDIRRADHHYREAQKINKEQTAPSLRLGHLALIEGNLEGADQYLNAVIGTNDKSVEANFLKGYIAWKTGDFESARERLAKASQFARPVKPSHGVLGEGDTKSGTLILDRKSLFYSHFADLPKMDDGVITRQMAKRYQRLDRFLKEVRKRIKN